ncbi:MAG: hypothetical protein U0234_18180 [Sandaracinus sp.]
MTSRRSTVAASLSILLALAGAGCGGTTPANSDAGSDAGAQQVDAGRDTGTTPDTGSRPDAATTADAGCTISPTFDDVSTQMFQVTCGGPINCHGSSGIHGGDLALQSPSTYAALVGVESAADPAILRVDPGHPETSLLYRKLVDDLPGDGTLGGPMPAGEGIQWHQLPDEQIELVRCWIANGAPE